MQLGHILTEVFQRLQTFGYFLYFIEDNERLPNLNFHLGMCLKEKQYALHIIVHIK